MKMLHVFCHFCFIFFFFFDRSFSQQPHADSLKQQKKEKISVFEYLKNMEKSMNENRKRVEEWGEKRTCTIYSNILNEERSYMIYIPEAYDKGSAQYPVLYRLDGDAHQLHDMVGLLDSLTLRDNVPQMILVSIINTDRTRDMMPVETQFCENPGAENFLSFLSDELVPTIEKNYRTTSLRILCGQSLSSVFTIYALLERPQLFGGIIAISAYFPRCKDYFMKKAGDSFQNKLFQDSFFYFTRGALDDRYNIDGVTEKALSEMIGIIGESNHSGFRWAYKVYDDYGHCPEPSLADGLTWIFKKKKGG